MTNGAWRSRGYLPHIDRPGAHQVITWHVADSLPRAALDRMQRELDAMPADQRPHARMERLQHLLDAGSGCCPLRDAAAATCIETALLHFDELRYRLCAWSIMPNHVHALIEVQPDSTLADIVHSWKSWTAHRIAGPRPFWFREYWDRYIRDDDHWFAAVRYIDQNPVRAGLVPEAECWPWGSARFGLR